MTVIDYYCCYCYEDDDDIVEMHILVHVEFAVYLQPISLHKVQIKMR